MIFSVAHIPVAGRQSTTAGTADTDRSCCGSILGVVLASGIPPTLAAHAAPIQGCDGGGNSTILVSRLVHFSKPKHWFLMGFL